MLNSPTKRLPTQSEDTHGISKTVFTHVSRLHGLLNDWIRVRDKGTKLCKAVIALKLHECTNDYYPHQLQPLTESLTEVLESLNDIIEGVAVINKQLQALAKLQQVAQPVILTWTAKDISENVIEVFNTLQQEYRLKSVVTENIAHCRDEKLLDMYGTSWEFDTYFRVESTAYLFTEGCLVTWLEAKH
ncbi:uncharacterized protein LOC134670177 [Cydia fagiglandana]|uniref:uncharacterized protein LOC134670177 n=1 Tax=Cydia fagiglandana TaxID=1458189 RepID=UPI002FEE3777